MYVMCVIAVCDVLCTCVIMPCVVGSSETNQPPEARAGEDQTVFLPTDFVKLNGAKSTDDQKIETYKWTQVRSVLFPFPSCHTQRKRTNDTAL